jgi:GT2 family glycosyltransferase
MLRHHIDEPSGTTIADRCPVIRGWCFAEPGQTIRAIQLAGAGIQLKASVGVFRPDVKTAFPEAPGEHTGFEIRGVLPAGKYEMTLAAQRGDGRWIELTKFTVSANRRYMPRWINGQWNELLFSQMPAQVAAAPRKVREEKFPRAAPLPRTPRLAIVTPSFNQASFLAETMRSVLDNQAGMTCDYVVEDGGSTDGSVDLIRRQAGRLHSWGSQPDAGQADAIVRGLARTDGAPEDVMAWLNSDDFYLPGALPFVADYFARHPNVDVIYGHRIVVDEASQETGRWFLPPHDPAVLDLYDFVPQETLFWRRRIWEKVGGLDTSFKFAMDWDLLLRFQAAAARIARVPYFLACFRVHAAQKTTAEMYRIGQREIDCLRTRTQGRAVSPEEIERDPRLLRYLRRSALTRFLWQLGIRLP